MATKRTTTEPTPPIDLSGFKIQPRYVIADDCTIEIEGEERAVHVGEGVWVLPVGSVSSWMALAGLMSGDLDDSRKEQLLSAADNFEHLTEALAERIAAWTFTDLRGRPLPQPYGKPDVLRRLSGDEIIWLLGCAQGASKAEQKND